MAARRWIRWTYRGLIGLTALAAVAIAGGYLWLRGSLPMTEGRIAAAGLKAPVELLRDADGIVTIRAQSLRDAYFAVGYAHAQDRLWQMDFMRRSAAGRLSEVVGPATLWLDRLMRGLGLYRVAEANVQNLGPEAKAALEAYAAGVNAFLAAPGGPWPPEYYLLRYRPEPWRPADSMVWGRLMALQLSGNWRDEIRRSRLARDLTEDQIAFLWPAYPTDGPISTGGLLGPHGEAPPRRLSEILPWRWMPKSASNSWVLSGERTASGMPILANDPHLALRSPGTWYLVRIETPDRILAGATAPGVPFVIVGHNGRVAWGFTTTESDTQDLFIERLSGAEGRSYETPDGPRPFEVRTETIEVRGEAPVVLTVRATRHGPVLSDFLPEAAQVAGAGEVVALAWPALEPDDGAGDAFVAMARARDGADFVSALRRFHSPQQNIVYADSGGAIGLIAPARVPLRRKGDGRRPVPGWTGAYDWSGFIPFEELPRSVNPPRGRIVAANNRLVPDDYPHLISADWGYPHRAARIEEMLDAAAPRSGLEQHLAFQLDNLSSGARELLPLLLAAEPKGEPARQAHGLLQAWDHLMDRSRPEPLIFYAWIGELNQRLLGDELGDHYAEFARVDMRLIKRVLSEGTNWCDDVRTTATESCDEQLSAALEAALADLAESFGADLTDWRWGAAHTADFPHPVISRLPVLDKLFGFALETDGGNTTVNRGAVGFTGNPHIRFNNVHGAGYRAVYDLADLDNSRFMIAIGQSGNPLSPHYGDLAERWRDGDYVKLDGKATAQRLLLTPPTVDAKD